MAILSGMHVLSSPLQGAGEEGAALGPRHVHHGGRLHALLGALGHRILGE